MAFRKRGFVKFQRRFDFFFGLSVFALEVVKLSEMGPRISDTGMPLTKQLAEGDEAFLQEGLGLGILTLGPQYDSQIDLRVRDFAALRTAQFLELIQRLPCPRFRLLVIAPVRMQCGEEILGVSDERAIITLQLWSERHGLEQQGLGLRIFPVHLHGQ